MNSSSHSQKVIQAVLFDMDGVLVDSAPYYEQVETEVMESFGVHLPPEILRSYKGSTFVYKFSDLLQRYDLKVSLEKILQKHRQLIEKYYREIFPAMIYAADVLGKLRMQGYHLALVTSFPADLACATLKRLKLFDFFEVKVFGDEVKEGKPSPEPYVLATSKLGIQPEYTAVVEDAENGFKSAKAAGTFLIAYENSYNGSQDFSLADEIITDLREIFFCLY